MENRLYTSRRSEDEAQGLAMKQRSVEGFGDRLAQIRQSRSMTQTELGEAVGVSNRVIHYYEQESAQPPGALLADLARALGVTADELLGLQPTQTRPSPQKARMLKRLERVADLPAADRRAVFKLVDALLESRGLTNGRRASG